MGWLGELWWDRNEYIIIIHQILLKLFLLCQVESDFDATWCEWYKGSGLQSNRADFDICIDYVN